MPKFKAGCPGQNVAYLKDFNTNMALCTKCGYEVEFFSDEKKVKCPKCHNNVFKINPEIIKDKNGKIIFSGLEKTCLDWCGGCLDKKDYQDILENNERIDRKKEDFKILIDSVDKKDSDVVEFLIEAFQKSINHTKLIDQKVFEILKRKKPDLFIKVRNYYLNFLNTS